MFRDWKPYVSAAARRKEREKFAKQQAKSGAALSPVVINGRAIATTFWGRSWCETLESWGDYENRLPRGRTYARNGSIIDLKLTPGRADAIVYGSEKYRTSITIKALAPSRWKGLVEKHAGHVSSLVDLLQGRLPKSLLETLADPGSGLFPSPDELDFKCSCPDWAQMCKHVAAVLYGIGSRLDSQPELFFVLRGVEVSDLAARGASADFAGAGGDELASSDLGALFGIELAEGAPAIESPPAAKPKASRKAAKAPAELEVKEKPARATRTATKAAIPTRAKRSPPVRAAAVASSKNVPPKAPVKPKTITLEELRTKGVTDSTRNRWMRTGVLVVAGRGLYELTPEVRRLLKSEGRAR